jgi:hypothetical protein
MQKELGSDYQDAKTLFNATPISPKPSNSIKLFRYPGKNGIRIVRFRIIVVDLLACLNDSQWPLSAISIYQYPSPIPHEILISRMVMNKFMIVPLFSPIWVKTDGFIVK